MNTIVAAQRQPTKLEAFMGRVLPPEKRDDIARALPRHVSIERFERNLANALMNQPRLMDLSPPEVFREVAKIAALGLVMDAQLGEAYLIASSTGPQARIGYRGLIKLGRQSGDLSAIYAHAVHERDLFKCVLGDEKRLVHEPDLFGNRGQVVGYYAVAKFKDGDTDFEPMTMREITAIRDRSDGWKAFKAGKIKDTPWASFFDEMAKKTCIRRLMKRMPQSPDLTTALALEDAAEHTALRDVTPPHPSTLAIVTPRTPEVEDVPAHDPETGEIQEPATGVTAAPQDARAGATGRSAAPAAPASTPDTGKPPVPAARPPKPSARTATAATKPAFPGVDDRAALAAWVEAVLRDGPPDALDDRWNEIVEPKIIDIFPPERADLDAIYRRVERELAP